MGEASCKAVRNLRNTVVPEIPPMVETAFADDSCKMSSCMDFVWASILDFDFTDADIIFMCSVLFPSELVSKLAATARWMKLGSRIIAYEPLEGPEFREIGHFSTPTTWSHSTRWTVQEVIA